MLPVAEPLTLLAKVKLNGSITPVTAKTPLKPARLAPLMTTRSPTMTPLRVAVATVAVVPLPLRLVTDGEATPAVAGREGVMGAAAAAAAGPAAGEDAGATQAG